MEMHDLSRLAANFVAPVFWATIAALCLWGTRKLFPRAEKYLFGPSPLRSYFIGRLVGRQVRVIRQSFSSLRGSRRPSP
jgi:hypothetical protein